MSRASLVQRDLAVFMKRASARNVSHALQVSMLRGQLHFNAILVPTVEFLEKELLNAEYVHLGAMLRDMLHTVYSVNVEDTVTLRRWHSQLDASCARLVLSMT